MADGTRDDNGTGMPTQRLSESDWAGRVLLADTGRYSSQGGLQTGRGAITDAYNRTSASGFTPRPEQPIPDPKSMAGAPTSKDEQKPPTTKAVGSTGTQIFGGIIAQTQEYNEDFYWRAAIDVYEQMRRTDAQVAAILTMLYLPIERADWDITPASDDPADVELASFVKSALFDDLVYVTTEGRTVRQAWQSIVQQVLTMLPFGFSVFAKWWRIDDEGYVKLARLEPILQRTLWRWWPGADNQLVGVQQRGFRNWQIVYEDIHADALLLFVNRQEGSNYDGWSVLRAAYKHWYYLDVFYRLQGIGIEKHTFMPPIGILGPLANASEDADALLEQLKNIRTADSNGIVTPHGSSVEFPKGLQRGSGQEMEFAIHHHDDKIARSVLASFVSMGSNETGTFALADVLVRTFYDTLQGTLEYICGVFNTELIPQLVNYNFRNVQIYPKLTGGSVRHIDMADITALLPYLNGDPQLEDWLRKLAGAPMAPKSAVNTTNPSGSQPGADGQRPQGNDLSGGGKNGKNSRGSAQGGAQRGKFAGNSDETATGEGADGGADGDGGGGGSALSEVALLTDALASLGLVDAVERAEAHGAHGRTLLSNPYPRGPHGQWGEGGEHGMHSHVGKGLKGHGAGEHEPVHARGPHEGEKVGGGRKAGGGGSKRSGSRSARSPEEKAQAKATGVRGSKAGKTDKAGDQAKTEAPAKTTERAQPEGEHRLVPMNQIHVGLNPREHFDEEGIAELAKSIKENGLLQPITVRPHEGGYQIIAGERRFRAMRALNAEHIPAIVRNVDDKTASHLALIENVNRRDMRPGETARAYQSLLERGGMSAKELAGQIGKSEAHVQQHLDLLTLHPELQRAVDEGRLPMSLTRDFARLSTAGQREAAEHIISHDLGARSAKTYLKALQGREAQTSMFPEVRATTHVEREARERYETAMKQITDHLHGLDDETMAHYARSVDSPAREAERLGLMAKQLRRMQRMLEQAHQERVVNGGTVQASEMLADLTGRVLHAIQRGLPVTVQLADLNPVAVLLSEAMAEGDAGAILLSNPYPRGPHGHYGEGGEHGEHQSQVGKGLKGHGSHNPEHATGPHEGEKVGGGARKAGGGGSKRGGGGKSAAKGETATRNPLYEALRQGHTVIARAHNTGEVVSLSAQAHNAHDMLVRIMGTHGMPARLVNVEHATLRHTTAESFAHLATLKKGTPEADQSSKAHAAVLHQHASEPSTSKSGGGSRSKGAKAGEETGATRRGGGKSGEAAAGANGAGRAAKSEQRAEHERFLVSYHARQDEEMGLKPGTTATLAKHGFVINPDNIDSFGQRGYTIFRDDSRAFVGENMPTIGNTVGSGRFVYHPSGVEHFAQVVGANPRAITPAGEKGQSRLQAERDARNNNHVLQPHASGTERAAHDELAAFTAHGTKATRAPKAPKASGGAKAEKAPAEGIHERAARLQRAGGLKPEARPGNDLKAIHTPEEMARLGFGRREIDPALTLDSGFLTALYGEHQLGAALHRYGTAKINEMARTEGLPPSNSKAATISRIVSHVTNGRYSANFGKTVATATSSTSRAKAATSEKVTRAPSARTHQTAKAKAPAELKAIAHIPGHEIDPGRALNPHFVRALYGDHQLHAALNRYTHDKLREAADHIGVHAGSAKATTIKRIVTAVTKAPYEQTLKQVGGTPLA